MSISNLLALGEKECLAIIGSGGKTSLLFRLAEENKEKRVLLTTTTKLFMPQGHEYDQVVAGDLTLMSGRTLLYGSQVGEKIIAPTASVLAHYAAQADLTLMECDGSRTLPLKSWAAHEPQVPAYATKTIALLPLWAIGKKISDETVHRLDGFLKLCGAKAGDIIELSHLKAVIEHKDGLFAKACGQKVLCLNCKADMHSRALKEAQTLKQMLAEETKASLFIVCCDVQKGQGVRL